MTGVPIRREFGHRFLQDTGEKMAIYKPRRKPQKKSTLLKLDLNFYLITLCERKNYYVPLATVYDVWYFVGNPSKLIQETF